uniref:WAP domain-containing protein n=1 Tax=Cyprinus carpio TaxID=7962 RepID=A0A8C1PBT5_CYPCA
SKNIFSAICCVAILQCKQSAKFLSRVCVTEKPGVCPRYNVIGICVVSKNNCFNDGECPNDEKCCSYGCGRQCMDPYREKPGVCPRNNVIGICVVSKNNCFNDGECPNDQKCCSYGCGSQCMDPYRVQISYGLKYLCRS